MSSAIQRTVCDSISVAAKDGTPRNLTKTSNAHERDAVWSPDGRSLAFQKNAQAPSHENDIVSRDATGHWGAPRTLLRGGYVAIWAPDGRGVLTLMDQGDGTALGIVPPSGGALRPVIQPGGPSPGSTSIWAWSPGPVSKRSTGVVAGLGALRAIAEGGR